LLASEVPGADGWDNLLRVTVSQVQAAERGDWRSVQTLMAARVLPASPCPEWLRQEYWGAHQALRELLAARLVALEAEIRRLQPTVWRASTRDPLLLDRRD
jgi:hypothetical protein